MKPLPRTVAATALVLGGALAVASPAFSDESFASRLNQTRPAAHEGGAGFAAAPVAGDAVAFTSGSGISEVRYRPRRSPRSRPRYYDDDYGRRRAEGYTQFHGGFLEPDGSGAETQTVFGIKLAGMADPHIQVGGLADWAHRGRTVTEVVSTSPGPGGTEVRTQYELARSSTDLVPLLAFIQFSGDDRMGLVPYIGVGGGYQLLFLSAEDFTTGEDYDATFGGWGWQAWAGVGIPMSRSAKLTAEIFRNGGTVSREVDLPGGLEAEEEVDVDGTGARFGIAFSF